MTSIETTIVSKKDLFEFKSIKTKLMFSIIVILIVGGTALTGLSAFMTSGALTHSTMDTINAIGFNTATKIEIVNAAAGDIITLVSLDAKVISDLSSWNEGTLPKEELLAVSEYLTTFRDKTSDILEGIDIIDNKGIIIASSTPANIGKDYSQRDIFIRQEKGTYAGEPFRSVENIPYFVYARPVYADNGQKIALLYFAISIPTISDFVFATPGLSDDSMNFLVGPDGMILSGIKGDYSSFLTKKFDLSIFPAGTTTVQAPGYFGEMEYIVKTPVPGTSWSIITTETVDEVNGPIMELIWTMVVFLLIVIVVGAFVAIFISNSFTRPISALKDGAEKLAIGDMDVDITHVGIDEIGELADSFRNIIKNTKGRVNSASKVAAGEVNFKLIAASDRDIEGQALIQLKGTLADMAKSLQILANHSADGDLNYRADANQFQGVYRELIETLNQAFHQIINPLQETMRLSTSYSSGDYSDRFDPDITVKGDFVPFKAALNQIGINSSDALLKIRAGVNAISSDTAESSVNIEEIARSVLTLAEATSHVSSLAEQNDIDTEQGLAAMNDLTYTIEEVAKRTAAVSELASQASDLAYDGVKRAEFAENGMEEIMKSAEEISISVSEMSSRMDEIGSIVGIISDIADQTSLLALNAAIEAARAGDAGLGFAVVADEVKSLAHESQTSAEHIGAIIGNLQKISMGMAAGMEKASEVVLSGSNAVHETITIFQHMAEAISDVSKNMGEVAAASEEQAASSQEITASMTEVRHAVQETTREAVDSAAAAEEISVALDQLKRTAAQSAQLTKSIQEQVNMFKIES
jgi:methyl-accepting chemotaxis protein